MLKFLYYFTAFFVLCLIVIPSFFGSAGKAKQSGARQNIGAISRAQQAYFLENQTFARRLESLGLGISLESQHYSYRILSFSYPIQSQPSLVSETQNLHAIASIAYPKSENLKVYLGITWMTMHPHDRTELISQGIVCESEKPLIQSRANEYNEFLFPNFTYPSQKDTDFSCPVSFRKLGLGDNKSRIKTFLGY